jgi:hypothetical protein
MGGNSGGGGNGQGNMTTPNLWGWLQEIASKGWGPAPMSKAGQAQEQYLGAVAGPKPGTQSPGSQMSDTKGAPGSQAVSQQAGFAGGAGPTTQASQSGGLDDPARLMGPLTQPNRNNRRGSLLGGSTLRGLLGV